jgi:hypothetical protein
VVSTTCFCFVFLHEEKQSKNTWWTPHHRVHRTKKNKTKTRRVWCPPRVFVLFFFVLCTLWCGVHHVFLFCFSSSCVPYAASFSGLSICNCPFGILVRLFKQIHAFLCFKKFCIYMKYSYKIMWRILFAGLCTYASIYFTCELNSAQVDFSLYFAINSIKKQIVFTSSCLIYVVCVCLCIVVSNTYYVGCVFLWIVCPVLPISLTKIYE